MLSKGKIEYVITYEILNISPEIISKLDLEKARKNDSKV